MKGVARGTHNCVSCLPSGEGSQVNRRGTGGGGAGGSSCRACTEPHSAGGSGAACWCPAGVIGLLMTLSLMHAAAAARRRGWGQRAGALQRRPVYFCILLDLIQLCFCCMLFELQALLRWQACKCEMCVPHHNSSTCMPDIRSICCRYRSQSGQLQSGSRLQVSLPTCIPSTLLSYLAQSTRLFSSGRQLCSPPQLFATPPAAVVFLQQTPNHDLKFCM